MNVEFVLPKRGCSGSPASNEMAILSRVKKSRDLLGRAELDSLRVLGADSSSGRYGWKYRMVRPVTHGGYSARFAFTKRIEGKVKNRNRRAFSIPLIPLLIWIRKHVHVRGEGE